MKKYLVTGRDIFGTWMQVEIEAERTSDTINPFCREHGGNIIISVEEIAE